MRIGVKYSRTGFSKYISHLDMLRLVIRSVRRAGLPAKYSGGFNPHMVLSFASPLAVGVESLGDYFEFQTTDPMDLNEALRSLKKSMPEGMDALYMGEIPEGTGKLMALTEQAEYLLKCGGEFQDWLRGILSLERYAALKERKGKTKEVDIRSLILGHRFCQEGIELFLAHSAKATLSPLLLAEEAKRALGRELETEIIRKDLYTFVEGKLSPLEALFPGGAGAGAT